MKRKLNVRNFFSSVQDAFGNTVSKERLSEYAGRFSLRLSGKMGSKDEEDEEETSSAASVNFVVYHSPGMETLSASMGLSLIHI